MRLVCPSVLSHRTNRNMYHSLRAWTVPAIYTAQHNMQHISKYMKRHHDDAIMSTMAYQVTGVSIVCSTVYSGADQRKHQSSASLAFVRVIRRWPVNSSYSKGPVTRKMLPFDDVIMNGALLCLAVVSSSVLGAFMLRIYWLCRIYDMMYYDNITWE